MKKMLSILGAITLVGTSSTSLISCHDSNTFTTKTNDISNWKGTSLSLNYFVKNNDNKYYAVTHLKEKKWIVNLFYNDSKLNNLVLEPSYKVWQWKLETVPTEPKIDDNGNIII